MLGPFGAVLFLGVLDSKLAHPPAAGKGPQGCSVPHPGEHETFTFRIRFANPATPAKGTTCCRCFSIGNDSFTTFFTAQVGRGKLHYTWGSFGLVVGLFWVSSRSLL